MKPAAEITKTEEIMDATKQIQCNWSDFDRRIGAYLEAVDATAKAAANYVTVDAARPGPSYEEMLAIEKRVKAEVDAGPKYYMYGSPEHARVKEIEAPLVAIQQRLFEVRPAKAALEAAQKREANVKAALSPDLAVLSVEDLRSLLHSELGLVLVTEGYDLTNAEYAAVLRGEKQLNCKCDGGYVYAEGQWSDITVLVRLDDEIRHVLCHYLAQHGSFTPNCLKRIVPERFAAHRVASLAPHQENPIPAEIQAAQIASIPSSEDGLSGWLLVGDGGTSKTTYAAAALTDMFTIRYHERRMDGGGAESTLCAWSITVPEWLAETERYKYRDFDSDEQIEAPDVTAEAIRREADETGLRPILWIEEIDKVRMTEPRRILLFELINSVYKLDGLIVCTANVTLDELRSHLDTRQYPITRRIAGANDAGGYKIWDFWPLTRPTKAPKRQSTKQKTGRAS
jgi:hypothetical protein